MVRTIPARAAASSDCAAAGRLTRTSAARRRRAHEALWDRGPTIAPRRHGSSVRVHGSKIAGLAEHLVDPAGQLVLEDAIQERDDLVLVEIRHVAHLPTEGSEALIGILRGTGLLLRVARAPGLR